MRRSALAILLLLCGFGSAEAQAPRPAAAPGANPRDIRETFLALPVPAAAPGRPILSRIAAPLATRALRERALERALAHRSSFATLDTRNGYLAMCVPAANEVDCLGTLTVTYFNRADGSRLVVMQVSDPHGMRAEDYFWRLAGGRFTPVEGRTLLPDLTWADYWGDQPLPRGLGPRFIREMGAVRITWPREGTVAVAVVEPLGDIPGPRAEELAEVYETRRFVSIDLAWDRQRGVFVKARRYPYEPGEEDHDHH